MSTYPLYVGQAYGVSSSGLTVREVDGSPTGTCSTLVFPNGSVGIVGNTATITLAGSGDMVLASAQTVSGAKTFLDSTLLLRNVANTFAAQFSNTNTAARTYTLPNASGTVALTSDFSSYATTAAVAAGYQPLDSDLTSIAGLATTSFGRSLLTQVDAAATRTTIGAGTSSFDGAYSSLSGIPSTFTPTAHNHAASEITSGTLAVARGGTGLTSVGTSLQVLRTNAGATALEYATITAGSGDALTTSPLSQFAATTSAQLAGVISDETGSGSLVFATSPTLTTPNIGAATGTSLSLSGAVIGQNGTTPAGGVELYNTFTSASNYERMRMYFDSGQNAWTWADEKAGAGSNRGLIIRAGSPLRFIVGGASSARIDGDNLQTSTFTNGFICNLDGVGAANRYPVRLGGVWFSGGTSTSTKPQFAVEPTGTTSTGWNTLGTGIGVNAASGFAGNLIDLQQASVSRVSVSAGGNLTVFGTVQIGGGTAIAKVLSSTATLDFPSIASNDTHTLTMTVTGAVAGNSVFLGVPAALDANLIWCGSVTAADTVTIRMHNASGASIDPASGTYRATVFQF